MRTLTKGRPIESWPTRFATVASDLANGERVLINSGDAGLAVAAPASQPVVCAPVQWNGRMLVDGAQTEPVRSKAAQEPGATRVVAVDISYRPDSVPVSNMADSAFQSLHILVKSLIVEQARWLPAWPGRRLWPAGPHKLAPPKVNSPGARIGSTPTGITAFGG